MPEPEGAGHATRRFFRSPWFSALLGTIAVALVLVAVLGGSHGTPRHSHNSSTATTAQAASVAHPASTAPCGGNPLGLGGRWRCTLDYAFNGTSLDTSVWQPMLTASSGFVAGGLDCYVDNPNTISVSGGHLNLTVLKVAPFHCSPSYVSSYQAGMVTTQASFSQTYGAFEVNAKLPQSSVPGLQETFWMYPENLTYGPWPASGEIDFAEFYSQQENLDVPYVHYNDSNDDPNVTTYNCQINPTQFNTYGMDWTPTTLTFLYNGHVCLTDQWLDGPPPFNQPFYIALTQAIGQPGANAVNANTALPATTEIDWVRAWASGS